METHAIIARRNDGGHFHAIYLHRDGHPEGAGATLAEHYTDQGKIDALIDLGDIRSLGSGIGEMHDFYAPADERVTIAYGRDGGDIGTGAVFFSKLRQLRSYARRADAEWLYVWNGDAWRFAAIYSIPSEGNDPLRLLPWQTPLCRAYLRTGNDYLADAVGYPSKTAAVAAFAATARELARYGMPIEASVHMVAPGARPDEYPDFLLSVGPRGGVKVERA